MKMSTDREFDRVYNRIRFALISRTATPPTRKGVTDAGIDLYIDLRSRGIDTIDLYPNAVQIFHTGLKVCIPVGYVGWIANKSRADYLIGGGIVDQEYQGEILIKVINVTNDILTFNHGDAIAQMLIIPCLTPQILVTDSAGLYEKGSERGDDGGIARQNYLPPEYRELKGD
jgi:dUTP pyrophosphatase